MGSLSLLVRPSACLFTWLALAGLESNLGAQHTVGARAYELHIIRPSSYPYIGNSSVNSLGQVVGTSGAAFIWRQSTGSVQLGLLPGATGSFASDINRSGFVVGYSQDTTQYFATLWSPSGTAFPIPVPGAEVPAARGLNNAGVVVGNARVNGQPTCWIWDAVNGTRDLADFGLPDNGFVSDINEPGQVAGSQLFGQGFLLDLDTSTVRRVGTFGGAYSGAYGLNDLGHVVGWAIDAAYHDHPFLWSRKGGLKDLGTLAPFPLVLNSWAYSVNDDDVVVGASEVQTNDTHAFLWDAQDGIRDLNGLAHDRGQYELTVARHISGNGWIVGDAVDTAAGNASVAFVLRPK